MTKIIIETIDEIKENFDADSSINTIDFYVSNHDLKGLLGEGYCIVMTESKFKRLHYKKKESQFKLSGDCFFNFNNKKFSIFKTCIGEDRELLKKLEFCKSMHHSNANFCLMPTTGGMNNMKGTYIVKDSDKPGESISDKKPLDRGDAFVNLLYKYYDNGDEQIFSRSRGNKKCLEKFLNKLNFEEYCKKMLRIEDENLIVELCKNGSKVISTKEDLKDYMDLAIKFWWKRAELLNL